MNLASIHKILIIQTAFIGDVVLATPLIEAINHYNPSIKVDFLLRKGNENLLTDHPKLNKVLIWDKKNGKYKNLFQKIFEIRNENYDLVINLQRFASSGLITLLSKSKYTIGFDKNPFAIFFTQKVKHQIGNNQSQHETQRNLSVLEKMGIDTEGSKIKLYPSRQDFENISKYTANEYIVIAPASVWFTKQFPKSKWIEFLKELSIEIKVIFIGAKSDYDLSQQIIQESKHKNCVNLCGGLSFLESAALMKNAKMCFVNDSAPLHFASAMDAPTSAIFCSTIKEFGFGPLSSKSQIIEIAEKLECRPCGLHGRKSCPQQHFNCANKIDIFQLLKTIK